MCIRDSTHAIEAYVSTVASPYTDALAMKAIEMVTAYLPSSYNGNRESRAAMHDAQCLAGMAFSNALLGIVHSMAHKTGEMCIRDRSYVELLFFCFIAALNCSVICSSVFPAAVIWFIYALYSAFSFSGRVAIYAVSCS